MTWATGGGAVPNAADYAMIDFADQPVGGAPVALGDVTGWLGWQTLSLAANHTSKLGYPCNLDSCQKMQDRHQRRLPYRRAEQRRIRLGCRGRLQRRPLGPELPGAAGRRRHRLEHWLEPRGRRDLVRLRAAPIPRSRARRSWTAAGSTCCNTLCGCAPAIASDAASAADHMPSKFGLRFSRKAVMPSFCAGVPKPAWK